MGKIILLSGGMDSLISYRVFHRDAQPVFVRTGSRYEHLDIEFARAQAPNLYVLLCAPLREFANGVVPHRNATILSMVANAYDPEAIVVSAPRGELIWDQQPIFHDAMSAALRGVQVLNPLRSLTKTQAIAAWLADGGGSLELSLTSRSCYSSSARQCGKCPACVKRWIAMRNNGLDEQYDADVRHTARELAKLGTWRSALQYGLRPLWEAYRALKQ